MATVARTPDAELLRRLRARDRQAWEELYAEYQPRLRAFAYRLAGNVHDADDLVQETFVRAVPRLDRLDPETAEIAPYLFTTLRNLFLKQVERAKRQLPGGRYAGVRLTREPPAGHEGIGPTAERLARRADADHTRPTLEYYRRRDLIDVLVPVV